MTTIEQIRDRVEAATSVGTVLPDLAALLDVAEAAEAFDAKIGDDINEHYYLGYMELTEVAVAQRASLDRLKAL